MTIDLAKVPVVIGASVHTHRDDGTSPDALDLLELVIRGAAEDAGAGVRLSDLTHVWTISSLSLGNANPVDEVRRRLGATAETEVRYSTVGGSVPQVLVNRAAALVASGARPMVFIGGSEALATQKRVAKNGVLEGRVQLPPLEERASLWPPMDTAESIHRVETAHGLGPPVVVYAMIETAIAHAAGRTPIEHRRYMAGLMDRLNAVAAENPHSWFPTRRTAEQLARVDDQNRWVAFPYPKYMCSVMDVDMAAGFFVTDAQTARDRGLSASDVVYFIGGAEGRDIWIVAERPSLAASPGIEECAKQALTMARISLDDVTAFDLYSAFPSSVEMAMGAVGIAPDDQRPLSLTGGLPYHGGPGNNYVSHAIAHAFARARSSDDETILLEGSGYFITKHGVGIYSSQQPAAPPTGEFSVQATVDARAQPARVDPDASGPGEIVAYTVPFGRDGGRSPAVVLVDVGGARTVGFADDDLTGAIMKTDGVGMAVDVRPSPSTNHVSAR